MSKVRVYESTWKWYVTDTDAICGCDLWTNWSVILFVNIYIPIYLLISFLLVAYIYCSARITFQREELIRWIAPSRLTFPDRSNCRLLPRHALFSSRRPLDVGSIGVLLSYTQQPWVDQSNYGRHYSLTPSPRQPQPPHYHSTLTYATIPTQIHITSLRVTRHFYSLKELEDIRRIVYFRTEKVLGANLPNFRILD